MASITRQPPFRVAVHARTWLPGRQWKEQHDIMPFLEQETARLKRPCRPLAAQRTTLTTMAHHPAAGGDGGANSAHHGTERRDPGPDARGALGTAADAADAQVAEAQQDVLDASEPPQGIPRHVEVRLAALQKNSPRQNRRYRGPRQR